MTQIYPGQDLEYEFQQNVLYTSCFSAINDAKSHEEIINNLYNIQTKALETKAPKPYLVTKRLLDFFSVTKLGEGIDDFNQKQTKSLLNNIMEGAKNNMENREEFYSQLLRSGDNLLLTMLGLELNPNYILDKIKESNNFTINIDIKSRLSETERQVAPSQEFYYEDDQQILPPPRGFGNDYEEDKSEITYESSQIAQNLAKALTKIVDFEYEENNRLSVTPPSLPKGKEIHNIIEEAQSTTSEVQIANHINTSLPKGEETHNIIEEAQSTTSEVQIANHINTSLPKGEELHNIIEESQSTTSEAQIASQTKTSLPKGEETYNIIEEASSKIAEEKTTSLNLTTLTPKKSHESPRKKWESSSKPQDISSIHQQDTSFDLSTIEIALKDSPDALVALLLLNHGGGVEASNLLQQTLARDPVLVKNTVSSKVLSDDFSSLELIQNITQPFSTLENIEYYLEATDHNSMKTQNYFETILAEKYRPKDGYTLPKRLNMVDMDTIEVLGAIIARAKLGGKSSLADVEMFMELLLNGNEGINKQEVSKCADLIIKAVKSSNIIAAQSIINHLNPNIFLTKKTFLEYTETQKLSEYHLSSDEESDDVVDSDDNMSQCSMTSSLSGDWIRSPCQKYNKSNEPPIPTVGNCGNHFRLDIENYIPPPPDFAKETKSKISDTELRFYTTEVSYSLNTRQIPKQYQNVKSKVNSGLDNISNDLFIIGNHSSNFQSED